MKTFEEVINDAVQADSRESYEEWWRSATARTVEHEGSAAHPPPRVVPAGVKRIFYDSPKGLIPVYSQLTRPSRPDSHLGAVEA